MTSKDLALQRASRAALISGGLLSLLCAITALSRVSQQTFERFAPPEAYARALIAGAQPLCWIIGIDDVFIVSYLVSTTLLCLALEPEASVAPLLKAVIGATWLAGALDLLENHHILSMLRRAESGFVPSLAELDVRVVASSFKWLLGHAAFALLAFCLPWRGLLTRATQAALWLVQLPIGVAVLVVTDESWLTPLTWARYACLVGGFFGSALLVLPPAAPDRSFAGPCQDTNDRAISRA